MVPLLMNNGKLRALNLKPLKVWELGMMLICENDMNVIRSTWDFKLRCYPDRVVKKFNVTQRNIFL